MTFKKVIMAGPCGSCNGTGIIYVSAGPYSTSIFSMPCVSCGGTGRTYVYAVLSAEEYLAETLLK